MKPEVVQSTDFSPLYSASSIFETFKTDYWLAKHGKTVGQAFTMKVDDCKRVIVGCKIKNLGEGVNTGRLTRQFRVSGRVAKCPGSHKHIRVKMWPKVEKFKALLIIHSNSKQMEAVSAFQPQKN